MFNNIIFENRIKNLHILNIITMACIVETQSEKQINQEPDCPSCRKFYKNEIFDDFCFKCFMINRPEKYQLVVEKKGIFDNIYNDEELNSIVMKNTISNKHGLWRGIKLILRHPIDRENRFIALESIFDVLKKIANVSTTGLGLTAKQAGFLWDKFKPNGNFKFNTDWRIQHLFCGCVVDYWNLNSAKNGSVGYCYYQSSKPYKNEKFKIPPLLLKYGKLNKYKKLTRKEFERMEFWLKSLPF